MRAKKVDANHAAIRDRLRSIGWSVFDSSMFGRGFPDFVVAHESTKHTCVVEAKTTRGELNEVQRAFRDKWPGNYFVVRSPDDAEKQLTLWLLTLAKWK